MKKQDKEGICKGSGRSVVFSAFHADFVFAQISDYHHLNLTTLLLGGLRPSKRLISISAQLTNVFPESVERGNNRRKDFMINFHESM